MTESTEKASKKKIAPAKDQPMLSLRERKKQLAQHAIEEAALQLFEQKGYEQTSIQDIADAVMMSSRTFFRYFASKEEVLFGPMRAVLAEGADFLRRVEPRATPHAALRATLEHMASRYQQQRDRFPARYQIATRTPSIASIYLHVLMEAEPPLCDALSARAQAACDRYDTRFLVALYMTALRVTLLEWLEHDMDGDLGALLHRYMDTLSSIDGRALGRTTPDRAPP